MSIQPSSIVPKQVPPGDRDLKDPGLFGALCAKLALHQCLCPSNGYAQRCQLLKLPRYPFLQGLFFALKKTQLTAGGPAFTHLKQAGHWSKAG